MRRGKSPRRSMLKMVRSERGIIASSFFRLMRVFMIRVYSCARSLVRRAQRALVGAKAHGFCGVMIA